MKKKTRKPSGPSTRCRRLLRHLSGYVDGELDPAICETIEAHMPGCRDCRRFVASLRKTVAVTRLSGRRAAPSARSRRALRARLLELVKRPEAR